MAEDNTVNQTLAVRLLQKKGHEVIVAANGKEAVGILGMEPVDLVLMDLQMPEMGGIEATAAIRDYESQIKRGEAMAPANSAFSFIHSNLGHIPIVAMTAHAMRGDRERCLAAGMDEYISKPINPRELFEIIARLDLSFANEVPALPDEKQSGGIFDEDLLMARVDGDLELLRKVIEMFKLDCPRLLSQMQQAVTKQDTSALKRSAHSFRGGVAIFTTKSAYQTAEKLEQMATESNMAGAEKALLALRAETEHLMSALGEF